jgi:RNA polymerase sigma-70 factor (ECF subfamily)
MAHLDREEFARLFGEAYARLWTVAVAIIGDRHCAQDIVQEAAMTGLARLETYEKGTNFAAWMAQIVRYAALNARKSEVRRNLQAVDGHLLGQMVAATSAQTTEAVLPSGALAADQAEFDDRTTQLVESLDPERRACLLLRVVHGLSYVEIAEQLGVPEGTAMSHVHRAKETLRRGLNTPTGAGDLEGGGSHA